MKRLQASKKNQTFNICPKTILVFHIEQFLQYILWLNAKIDISSSYTTSRDLQVPCIKLPIPPL